MKLPASNLRNYRFVIDSRQPKTCCESFIPRGTFLRSQFCSYLNKFTEMETERTAIKKVHHIEKENVENCALSKRRKHVKIEFEEEFSEEVVVEKKVKTKKLSPPSIEEVHQLLC